ncbi:MAG TPA: DUF4381 domain-containing protein [Woeseiaceae bacterium]|nr:DUF4381 domain-containing protein [Woeseiaceae bacterium]
MTPSALPIRDLHLPDPVGWWPLAPGWWLLVALAAVGLGWLLRRWFAAHRRHAARRYALRQLKSLGNAYASHGNAVMLASQLSELLRRTMLAYAPRQDVAGLTGEDWLSWLDRGLDRSHFVAGDGRPLIEWPYRDPAQQMARSDVAALLDAVRLRIETPIEGQV